MEVYGATVISSNGIRTKRRKNGRGLWDESFTEIFPDKKAAVDYAVKTMAANFDSCDFEGDKDYNGQTKKDLEDALRAGENITIHFNGHISIEMFVKEMEAPEEKAPRKCILITVDQETLDLSVEKFPSVEAAHDEMLKQMLDQSDYNSEEELVDAANAGEAGYSDDEAWAVSRKSCGIVVWKIVAA